MRETQLQQDVLVPLFKAMQFRAVRLYHGGSLELGRDIVMWKQDDLRERVNYGVVVKAGRISGKAVGKDSANEVLFQIMQCLNEPYADLATAEEQQIQRCWVVSSAEISKEAINAIKSQLRSSHLDKVTEFIDGDRLWELIQEHMPECGIAEQLETAQKKLDELIQNEHYRVIANTNNEYFVVPRHPGAEKEAPFAIATKFAFDKSSAEGRQAFEEFQRHVKTGAPVAVKSQHVQELSFPSFLRPLLDLDHEKTDLILGQKRSDEKVPLKFEMFSSDGEVATLEYVDFEVVQQGTVETTLRNDHQAVPWRVTFVSNLETREVNFSLKVSLANAGVKPALQGLRFQHAMTKKGEFRIENLINGAVIREQYSPRSDEKVNLHLLRLLEELTFIQSRTNTPLCMPEGSITVEQAEEVFFIAQIIRTGRTNFKAEYLPMQSTARQIREALDVIGGGGPPGVLVVKMEEKQLVNIFGTEISLGLATLSSDRFHLEDDEQASLKQRLEACDPEDVIDYRLKLDGPFEALYSDWLPGDESVDRPVNRGMPSKKRRRRGGALR
jgi:hypothetical protein